MAKKTSSSADHFPPQLSWQAAAAESLVDGRNAARCLCAAWLAPAGLGLPATSVSALLLCPLARAAPSSPRALRHSFEYHTFCEGRSFPRLSLCLRSRSTQQQMDVISSQAVVNAQLGAYRSRLTRRCHSQAAARGCRLRTAASLPSSSFLTSGDADIAGAAARAAAAVPEVVRGALGVDAASGEGVLRQVVAKNYDAWCGGSKIEGSLSEPCPPLSHPVDAAPLVALSVSRPR